MPIEFFDCNCKTNSNKRAFGLCDDPPPSHRPAYIDETNHSDWIAIVENVDQSDIAFYAIDNCIVIRRQNGEMESRCDGMLHSKRILIFIELKDRISKGWLSDGCKQITTTIAMFRANYKMSGDFHIQAYICNKRRPLQSSGYQFQIEKFKDATGINLSIKQKINI